MNILNDSLIKILSVIQHQHLFAIYDDAINTFSLRIALGCSKSCSGSCDDSCAGGCLGSCSGSCDDSCTGGCRHSIIY